MSTNRILRRIKCCGETSICSNDSVLKLNQSTKLKEISQNLSGHESELQEVSNSIISSLNIRDSLKANFQTNVLQYESLTGKEKALKTAFVKALTESAITLKDEQPLLNTIEKMIQSNNETDIKNHIIEGLRIVEDENNKVFSETLLIAHKNASIHAGFSKIQIHQEDNLLRIIAENDKQQLMVSEISIDANNGVHAETETIGFDGKECEKAIEKFDESLNLSGVVASQCDKKPTGGQPIMQFAKQFVNIKKASKSRTGLRPGIKKQTVIIRN